MCGGSVTPAQVGVLSGNFLYPGPSGICCVNVSSLRATPGSSTSTGSFGTVGAGLTTGWLSPLDQLTGCSLVAT